MQDANGLSKPLLTVPVSALAGHQIDAPATKRGAAEITASELAGMPGVQDSTLETLRRAVADLLYAVSRIFQENPQDAREHLLLHSAALLRLGPSSTIAGTDAYDASPTATRAPRGGLAPWQVRKMTTYVEMHLDSEIVTTDLATLAKLSTFHFCRAFRESFNESPDTYVVRRRVERAQGLMLHSDASLAQIAIDCGFADQAHFNKAFRRIVDTSPGAWRRARAVVPR
ncbi:MAG TPA: AraC family transcriptional regulator [Steroidobacteraceae bacterium]|jgi:AraC-like DNA-binding protein